MDEGGGALALMTVRTSFVGTIGPPVFDTGGPTNNTIDNIDNSSGSD